MGLLESIAANGVGTALTAFGSFAKDLREAITGKAILDPNKQAEILIRAQEMENAAMLAIMAYDKSEMEGQLRINEAEAKSASFFVSGWRPAVGWVCVLALMYTYLAKPLLPWIITTWAHAWGKASAAGALPEVPMGDLLVLLAGLLGLGGMRMMEKKWKVASK